MIPHEKELVERLKNKPFALLGLNSDGPVEKVKQIVDEQKLTWRQGVLGSTDAPLPRKWNVRGWPTIYVIDAKGVIRYKNVRGKKMDEAVDALLAEMGK
jgi:peroxiredoxin